MEQSHFTPRFAALLAATPRVNSNGRDHERATRMWMAISRMQEGDRRAEAAISNRNDEARD